MTKRILLAGILGGIAMFIWASLAHMVLPLGQTGIKEIPNEASVLSAMHSNLAEKSGLYMFPGMELGANPTREQQHQEGNRRDEPRRAKTVPRARVRAGMSGNPSGSRAAAPIC